MGLRRQFNQRQVEEGANHAPTGTSLIVDTDPVTGDLGIATLTADAASRSTAVPAGAPAKPIKPPKPPKPTNLHNNDAPNAVNDTVSTNEDVPAAGNCAGQRHRPRRERLTVASFQPAHGTVTVRQTARSPTPRPPTTTAPTRSPTGPPTAGRQQRRHRHDHRHRGQRRPDRGDDAYTIAEDTTLTVAAPGVLGNDTDADGDPLTAVLVRAQPTAPLTLNADGSFTYTPTANYNGPDSFTYQANDGTLDSQPATVTITVTAVNDAPVAGRRRLHHRRGHAADRRGARCARQRHRPGRRRR